MPKLQTIKNVNESIEELMKMPEYHSISDITKKAKNAIEYGAELFNKDPSMYLNENDDLIKSVFIGTVMSLAPSGKYWVCFGRGNLNLCPLCKGMGSIITNGKTISCPFCEGDGSREAFEDTEFNEALEEAACEKNCSIVSGEGDGCDLFLEMIATGEDCGDVEEN